MKIGIPKETAAGETRVILLPSEVKILVENGHEVLVEKDAGFKIHIYDKEYAEAGARVTSNREEIFQADLVVKLKVPTEEEFRFLRNNILFSMFHHEQNPQHIYSLGRQNALAIEAESIFNQEKERLLNGTHMTGEIGVLYAMNHLKVIPSEAEALILGYGRVASGAISMCNKLGVKVKILRKGEYENIEYFLKGKDLLINAITWPKSEREKKNYIVTSEMLDVINRGGVILDLAVDFPNPIQTCRPTSLSNPFYTERGKVHIGIYGYPGLAPLSSSRLYSKQILPLVLEVASNNGLEEISQKSRIGESISKAIIDPEKLNWQSLKPKEFVGSKIE